MNPNDISKLIQEIIEHSQGEDVSVVLESNDTPNLGLWFSVNIKNPHAFLGRDGEGLSALNHLVKKIVESRSPADGKSANLLIDINGFQKRKVEAIRAVAHMMAERARYFKSSIEVDPMPAFDRRIVHEFLADAIDLKTESEGEGRNRRVVIKYIGGL